jgi:two-component system, NtrC family, sensor kinase
MVKWPIRVKLIAGLSLVIGMMLTLMGGSMFGLHAFHTSNLTLDDRLPELGASTDLLQKVDHLDLLRDDSPESRRVLEAQVLDARKALQKYFDALKKNKLSGNRGDGWEELGLAFQIDSDLTAILTELEPGREVRQLFPGTSEFMSRRPEKPASTKDSTLALRLERLGNRAKLLPQKLFMSYHNLLDASKRQYQSSKVIVWTSAVTVLGMLIALAALFHRWVLYPVRLLQRGVRRVARGSFDYHIALRTGDEMQALAEAFNDMTTRLSATYSDLERQVQERSRQLVRSERLAGVGFLAAGVAHEINNPLASIAFCSEALESRVANLLDAASPADAKVVRQYLRMIQEEAFRCKRITEKLLDFSRVGDLQRQRTDLVGLVQGVVEMVRHMGKYKEKQINFHPREPVLAHVDGQEIKQVVLNLLVNALDCMEPGGTLKIELGHHESMAEMVFTDDGCGMAPEVLENIFEPFFTRRKVGKGTGLGLSITHRIVSQHQGEIAAESPGEGLGATFTVRLPVRAPEGSAPAEESRASKPSGARAA